MRTAAPILGFCSVLFVTTSCRDHRADSSNPATLDNLISSTLKMKSCGNQQAHSPRFTIEFDGVSDTEVLRARVGKTMSAAPIFMQQIFNINGKIIVTEQPYRFCPNLDLRGKRDSLGSCWNLMRNQHASSVPASAYAAVSSVPPSVSSVLRSPGAELISNRDTSFAPSHPILAVRPEFIEHGLIKGLAYLYFAKFREIRVARRKVSYTPNNDNEFYEDMTDLTVALIGDIKNNQLDRQKGFRKSLISEMFGDILPKDQREQKSYFEDNRNSLDLKFRLNVVAANTFDSWYCSKASRHNEFLNFPQTKNLFHDRFVIRFEQFDRAIDSHSLALSDIDIQTTRPRNLPPLHPGAAPYQPFSSIKSLKLFLTLRAIAAGAQILQGTNYSSGGQSTGSEKRENSNQTNNRPRDDKKNPNSNNSSRNNNQIRIEGRDRQSGSNDLNAELKMVIDLTNQFRSREYRGTMNNRGRLPILRVDQNLMNDCKEHANWMQRTKTFEHYTENNSRSFSPRTRDRAENIAIADTAKGVTDMWINSAGHRKNMLGNYSRIGVARTDRYWCMQLQ